MTTKDTHTESESAKRQKTKSESKAFIARAVGRRKEAIARVALAEGIGKITVNGKDFTQYFPTFELQKNVQAPLVLTDMAAGLDVSVKVIGGGVRGQSDAVRHGISRALLSLNQDLRKTLRSEGFLTRDPRVKERKKPGLKRARRAPQFSKR